MSGIAGRPTGTVRINPKAPYADKLVGAYLFSQASGGMVLDLVGRTHLYVDNSSIPNAGVGPGVGASFGTSVGSDSSLRLLSSVAPPVVNAVAIGGYNGAAGQSAALFQQNDGQYLMATSEWGIFMLSGAWRFGYGFVPSQGSGTAAPIGRFDVGVTRTAGVGYGYVDGVLSNSASSSFNGTSTNLIRNYMAGGSGLAFTGKLDYMLLFSCHLPASAFAEIRRNPYQYFQTARQSTPLQTQPIAARAKWKRPSRGGVRPLNRSHPLAQGLAYWHLTQPDAIGGMTSTDLVQGRTGTLAGWSGTVPYVLNPVTASGALAFGTGRYVDLGSAPLLPAGTEWSVGAWAYITDQTNDACIISQRQSTTAGSNPFAVYSKNGQLAISYDNGFLRFGPTFTTNAWWYLAMTFTSTTVTVHMISTAGAYSTSSSALDARVKTGSGITAYLGAIQNQTTAYWPGYLDCISLHSRALSAAEVQEMWRESMMGFPGLLQATRPAPMFYDPYPPQTITAGAPIASTTLFAPTVSVPTVAARVKGKRTGRGGARTLNMGHPLNIGRKAWYLALPDAVGGTTFFDLTSGQQGSLVGYPSGQGWKPSNRPGGYAHIANDYTAGVYVDLAATNPIPTSSTAFSIAIWVNFTSLVNNRQAVFSRVGGAGGWGGILVNGSSSSPASVWRVQSGTGSVNSPITLATNRWYRMLYTNNNGNVVMYQDGVQINSGFSTLTADASVFMLGNDTQNNRPLSGFIDSFSMWDRILSPSEAALDYAEEVSGYPTTFQGTRPAMSALRIGGGLTISANLLGPGSTLHAATLTPGAVGVAAGFLSAGSQTFNAAVTPGAVTVSANSLSAGSQLHHATVTASNTLSAGFLSATSTTYGATVTPGAVTVSGAFLSAGTQLHNASISQGGGTQTVSGNFLSSASTLHNASVASTATVSGNLLGPTSATFNATLSATASISANLLAATTTLHQAVVSNAGTIASNLLGPTSSTFNATLTPGAVTVSAGFLLATSTAYNATVSQAGGGTQTVNGNFLSSATTLHNATLASTATIGANHLASAAQAFNSTVSATATVSANLLNAGTALYGAVVSNAGTITASAFGPTSSAFNATLTPGPVSISASLLPSGSQLHAASLFSGLVVGGQLLDSGATFYGATIVPGEATIFGIAPTPFSVMYNAMVSGGGLFYSVSMGWTVVEGQRFEWELDATSRQPRPN